jgi:hypothetical protein
MKAPQFLSNDTVTTTMPDLLISQAFFNHIQLNEQLRLSWNFAKSKNLFNWMWLKNAWLINKSGIVVVTVSLLRNWGAFIGVCTQR